MECSEQSLREILQEFNGLGAPILGRIVAGKALTIRYESNDVVTLSKVSDAVEALMKLGWDPAGLDGARQPMRACNPL